MPRLTEVVRIYHVCSLHGSSPAKQSGIQPVITALLHQTALQNTSTAEESGIGNHTAICWREDALARLSPKHRGYILRSVPCESAIMTAQTCYTRLLLGIGIGIRDTAAHTHDKQFVTLPVRDKGCIAKALAEEWVILHPIVTIGYTHGTAPGHTAIGTVSAEQVHLAKSDIRTARTLVGHSHYHACTCGADGRYPAGISLGTVTIPQELPLILLLRSNVTQTVRSGECLLGTEGKDNSK